MRRLFIVIISVIFLASCRTAPEKGRLSLQEQLEANGFRLAKTIGQINTGAVIRLRDGVEVIVLDEDSIFPNEEVKIVERTVQLPNFESRVLVDIDAAAQITEIRLNLTGKYSRVTQIETTFGQTFTRTISEGSIAQYLIDNPEVAEKIKRLQGTDENNKRFLIVVSTLWSKGLKYRFVDASGTHIEVSAPDIEALFGDLHAKYKVSSTDKTTIETTVSLPIGYSIVEFEEVTSASSSSSFSEKKQYKWREFIEFKKELFNRN